MDRAERDLYWSPGLCSREGGAAASRTPGRVDADVRDVIERTRTVLRQVGFDFGQVVGACAYVARPEWAGSIERAVRASFTHPSLASTLVLVPRLPGRAGFELRVAACGARAEAPREPAIGGDQVPVPSSDGVYRLAAASSDAMLAGASSVSFAQQMRGVLASLRDELGRRGCSLADVVSAHVYLADLTYIRDMNELYREAFGGVVPVRTTLGETPDDQRGLVRMSVVALNPAAQVPVERMAPGRSGVLVPAIRVGDDVWLSGVAGVDTGGIERQVLEVMEKYATTLRDVRLSFADVVDAEIALRNLDHLPAVERVLSRYLRGPGLTRVVFQAADVLGAAGIEVTLFARARPS